MLLVGVFWAILLVEVVKWLKRVRGWIDALLVIEMVESRATGRRMKDMFKDVLEFLLDQTSKVGLRFILSSFIILPDPSPWIVLRLCF
jgi:hypothetical protein